MTNTFLPKDVWTEVFVGVTAQTFHLTNYPDIARSRSYKINCGDVMPAIDSNEFLYYPMRSTNEHLVVLNNITPTNVYIMPLYDDGHIIY